MAAFPGFHGRDTTMRAAFYATLLTTGLLASGFAAPAFAAPDPSVADVIKALVPTADGLGRGSRPIASPQAASPSAAAAPAAAAPVVAEGSGALDLSVRFNSGQADLTADARHTLDILGQALTSPQLSSARIRIEGHTDTTGTREANLALSWRRSVAAVSYLQERFGIPASRLEAVGRGQDDLLIKTGENVDEPRNRRVHVVNISR